ncbi:hypothetical protein L1049_003506 [Liquidambar formosana]|uniref:Uncharacterized protein n=1 Tax=Liquidambar formosana TaxID=63359 RepID=A0AAP0N5J8_LIQFO
MVHKASLIFFFFLFLSVQLIPYSQTAETAAQIPQTTAEKMSNRAAIKVNIKSVALPSPSRDAHLSGPSPGINGAPPPLPA